MNKEMIELKVTVNGRLNIPFMVRQKIGKEFHNATKGIATILAPHLDAMDRVFTEH